MGSPVKYLLPAIGASLTALLLGYLWPQPDQLTEATNQEAWAWPDAPQPTAPSKAPSKLSTYWPGTAASEQADARTDSAENSAPTHSWRLIGIIRQGQSLSAQVLDPQQQIMTLSIGDALDAQRRVTAIEGTRLRWQNTAGALGELLLYPQPTAKTHTQPAVQPEPK